MLTEEQIKKEINDGTIIAEKIAKFMDSEKMEPNESYKGLVILLIGYLATVINDEGMKKLTKKIDEMIKEFNLESLH